MVIAIVDSSSSLFALWKGGECAQNTRSFFFFSSLFILREGGRMRARTCLGHLGMLEYQQVGSSQSIQHWKCFVLLVCESCCLKMLRSILGLDFTSSHSISITRGFNSCRYIYCFYDSAIFIPEVHPPPDHFYILALRMWHASMPCHRRRCPTVSMSHFEAKKKCVVERHFYPYVVSIIIFLIPFWLWARDFGHFRVDYHSYP